LLVVNNNMGVEFRLNSKLEPTFNEDLEPLTAAGGHFGSAKGWAESAGFHYMAANTKEDFLSFVEEFCNADIDHFDKPVLFEVFTKVVDEQDGIKMLVDANLNVQKKILNVAKKTAKKVLPKGVVDKIEQTIKG